VHDTLLSLGGSVTYVITDELNPACADTLEFITDTCNTNCVLSNIELRLIDTAYLSDFPTTPEIFAGCQSDTTHFVALRFNERFSDGSSFRIIIDSENFGVFDYEPGDGNNLAFVPVFGDSLEHTIMVVDIEDASCSIASTIMTPKCFKECIIFASDLEVTDCIQDSVYVSLDLNIDIEPSELIIKADGSSLPFGVIGGDTLSIPIYGDGLSTLITIQEAENALCVDSLAITAPYCLDCNLTHNITLVDSCSNGDTQIYNLENLSGMTLQFTINGTTSNILPATIAEFTIQADGSSTSYTVASLTDMFCTETVTLLPEDCSPIICNADFTTEINELTAIFTDSSTTSEPITSQTWTITGGITVTDTETFTFNFSEAATYNVCHTIVTDSCQNTICKDILIDPCETFIAGFTWEQQGDGIYQFNANTSSLTANTYLYDFGDSNTSTEAQPTHTFLATGVYNVCLTATNDQYGCENTYCEEIDFISSLWDPTDDKIIKVYPNPVTNDQKVTIESSEQLRGYAVYNTAGQLLQAADVFGNVHQVTVRLQNKPHDGILLLKIKTKKGNYIRKVLNR